MTSRITHTQREKALAALGAITEGKLDITVAALLEVAGAFQNRAIQAAGGATIDAFTVGSPTLQILAAKMFTPRASGVFVYSFWFPYALGSADTAIFAASLIPNATSVTGGSASGDWTIFKTNPVAVNGGGTPVPIGAWVEDQDAATLLRTAQMGGLFKATLGQPFALQIAATTATSKSITNPADTFLSAFELP